MILHIQTFTTSGLAHLKFGYLMKYSEHLIIFQDNTNFIKSSKTREQTGLLQNGSSTVSDLRAIGTSAFPSSL